MTPRTANQNSHSNPLQPAGDQQTTIVWKPTQLFRVPLPHRNTGSGCFAGITRAARHMSVVLQPIARAA